jgi:glycosyltransferase involved in cell wall biosynthesis
VKEWVGEMGLDSHVVLPGLQTDVRPFLAAMDVFMMTSQFEGLPVAMLEAMAMERAVASTGAGGVRDVLEPGTSGFVVDVDRPQDLVPVVEALLRDSRLRNRLGRQARVRVEERFSLQRMVRDLEALYADCLARPTRTLAS